MEYFTLHTVQYIVQCTLHSAHCKLLIYHFFQDSSSCERYSRPVGDNPWDISGEDSGSNKDWDPLKAQEDSTHSDNEPVNEAGAVTSRTSSGNQAVVYEDPEIRVYMDPPVERPDMDTDKDSDDFDQPDGLIHHFLRLLLGSGADARKRANKGGKQQRLDAEEESEDDQEVGDGDRRPVRRPPSIRD